VVDTTLSRLCVGDGATAGGIKQATAVDVQNQKYIYPTVGGTGDAITLTNSPAITAYATGQTFCFKAGSANTTATQVNVDGKGLKDVKKMNKGALAALVANDIISGGIYDILYDGTQFQIKGLSEGPYTSGSLVYLATYTASSSATIDIDSKLSSTYDDYLIVIDDLLPASTADLWLRMSVDNGSTFDAGSNYRYSNLNDATLNNNSNNTDSKIVCSNHSNSLATSGGLSGSIYLHNVNSTSGTQKAIGSLSYKASNPAIASVKVGGMWSGTGPVTAVRFLMDNSGAVNMASGTFKIYGIAKS